MKPVALSMVPSPPVTNQMYRACDEFPANDVAVHVISAGVFGKYVVSMLGLLAPTWTSVRSSRSVGTRQSLAPQRLAALTALTNASVLHNGSVAPHGPSLPVVPGLPPLVVASLLYQ